MDKHPIGAHEVRAEVVDGKVVGHLNFLWRHLFLSNDID